MGSCLRAQTALMEVFLAILLMMPATLLVSYTLCTVSNIPQMRMAEYANAFYDFVGLAYYNATVRECILNASRDCTTYFSDIFSEYGGIHAHVVIGDKRPVDNQSCGDDYYRCLPVLQGGEYTLACLYLCGG